MHDFLNFSLGRCGVIKRLGKSLWSLQVEGRYGFGAEDLIGRRSGEGVVAGHAIGHRPLGQGDVIVGPSQKGDFVPPGGVGQDRLNQDAGKDGRELLINFEHVILQVVHVSAEKLVASVAGQDHFIAGLSARQSTVVAGDGR